MKIPGQQAPRSGRHRRSGLFAAAAVVSLLALSPPAFAATLRAGSSSFGSFSGTSPEGLTVDQSNGDVYAIDYDNGQLDRFTAAGAADDFSATGDNSLD